MSHTQYFLNKNERISNTDILSKKRIRGNENVQKEKSKRTFSRKMKNV